MIMKTVYLKQLIGKKLIGIKIGIRVSECVVGDYLYRAKRHKINLLDIFDRTINCWTKLKWKNDFFI